MRKITEEIVTAFLSRQDKTIGNSHAHHDRLAGGNISRLYLHGNLIAEMYEPDHANERRLRLTLAGWPTPTTRERLNGLCEKLGYGRAFYQHNHAQYFSAGDGDREITAHESLVIVGGKSRAWHIVPRGENW